MQGMNIAGGLDFDKTSNKLFFSITPKPEIKAEIAGKVPVDIWSCHDDEAEIKYGKMLAFDAFKAVFSLVKQNRVIRLQQTNDHSSYLPKAADSKYILYTGDDHFEREEWQLISRPNLYLISTDDGSRMLIKKRLEGHCDGFSLNGKYVLWYDAGKKNWFTYNVTAKIIKNITSSINVPLYSNNDQPQHTSPYDIAGWFENDDAVLIYDRYDIWKVDPDGIKPPVNITGGQGLKNNTQLWILDFDQDNSKPIKSTDTLILSAFNLANKQNGFFRLTLDGNNMQKLVMSPEVYYFEYPHDDHDFSGFREQLQPIKAKQSNTYILKPMSSSEYPNIEVTTDFKTF